MEIEIVKIANRGVGIGFNNVDKITFVPYTAIGDVIDVEIVKSYKNYDIAKIVSILQPSPQRVEPVCKNFGICGGCDFMHVGYNTEIEYKRDVLENIFKQNIEVVQSDSFLFYRNKVVFHASYRSGKLKLGFMMSGSNRVVAIDNCYLIDKSVIDLKSRIEYLNIPLLEDVVFRISGNSILINFIGNKKYFAKYKKKILNLESEKKLIIHYNSQLVSKNRKYLEYSIDKVNYFVASNDFFQVNIGVAKKLFSKVKEYIGKIPDLDVVVDGFCGSMALGLQVKNYAKRVIGIEINSANVELAKKSIEKNGAKNCFVIEGDFFKEIKKIQFDDLQKSVLIVDPPREGIGKRVMNFIKGLGFGYIVYISCDPMTFKRDAQELIGNYENILLQAYDMFPRTAHLELFSIYKKCSE